MLNNLIFPFSKFSQFEKSLNHDYEKFADEFYSDSRLQRSRQLDKIMPITQKRLELFGFCPKMMTPQGKNLSVKFGRVVRETTPIPNLSFDDFDDFGEDQWGELYNFVLIEFAERIESFLKVRTLPAKHYSTEDLKVAYSEEDVDIFMADSPEEMQNYLSFVSSDVDGYNPVLLLSDIPIEHLESEEIPGQYLERMATEAGDQLAKLQTPTMTAYIHSVSLFLKNDKLTLVLFLLVKF